MALYAASHYYYYYIYVSWSGIESDNWNLEFLGVSVPGKKLKEFLDDGIHGSQDTITRLIGSVQLLKYLALSVSFVTSSSIVPRITREFRLNVRT